MMMVCQLISLLGHFLRLLFYTLGSGEKDAPHAVVQWYVRRSEARPGLRSKFTSDQEVALYIGATEDIEIETILDVCEVC